MVLCDSNVWLALALSRHAHHGVARDWFEGVEAASSVFFCRATQQTFLRLLTNAAVLAPYGNPPLTNVHAWEAYDALLADDRIAFRTEEPTGIEAEWKRFARRNTASPKLWMDAYLRPMLSPAGTAWSRRTPPSSSSVGSTWSSSNGEGSEAHADGQAQVVGSAAPLHGSDVALRKGGGRAEPSKSGGRCASPPAGLGWRGRHD